MDKKKKILYIITKSVWGGAQKYVFDLATHLPKSRFRILVAVGGRGPLYEKLREEGIPPCEVLHFQKSPNPLKDLFAFFELVRMIWILKPDIIHTNSSKAGGIASMAAKLYRISTGRKVMTVFTAHGWAFHEKRPRGQLFLIRLASRLTAAFHDHIICISRYDTDSAIAKNIAPAYKIQTIPNGIPATKFLPREEAQRKLYRNSQKQFWESPPPLVIGTIAEWTQNKGLRYLLEALPAVREKFPYVKAYLVGWGEEKSNLKNQISTLRLDDIVTMISASPASSYIKAFDIFVLPSLKEGLPYTVLEAGCAGVPVIATQVGGIPDIIEHERSGLLVKPASSKELADALLQLCNSQSLRIRFGASLKEIVKEKFSLNHMIQKTLIVYGEPAGG